MSNCTVQDPQLLVRAMTAADVPFVARLHLAAWQAAYRGLLSDALLDGLLAADFEQAWRQILARKPLLRVPREREPDGRTNLTAERGGELLGYVAFGPSHDPHADPERDGEIYGLYVHPDHWGEGIGKELLSAALERLRKRGFSQAVVWTMRDNTRARRFYASRGFQLDGGVRESSRKGEAFFEIRFSRPLERTAGRHTALILARAASLRDSLAVLLRALPQLGQIRQAETLSAALAREPLWAPDLVLYDLEPPLEEAWAALRRIKALWPRCRCLVLVENERWTTKADAAGADVVLTKGVRADRLLNAIQGSLEKNG